MTLRLRVTLLAASSVGIAVALMAVSAYFVVSGALYAQVNDRLVRQGKQLANSAIASEFGLQSRPTLRVMGVFNPDLDAQIVAPSGTRTATEPFEIGAPEFQVVQGKRKSSLRTVDGKQIYAIGVRDGSTLIIAQDLGPTQALLNRLAIVLSVVGGFGIVLAAVAGTAVGRTGLGPVARLTDAVQEITQTDELRPIEISGDDEIARLTFSFNRMLAALRESRERQSRLVADAGHELKTPLTSMRTNIELLISASRPGCRSIPEADRHELERDVIAQIEELSTLVGDLVDLAREDGAATTLEPVDISETISNSLERVRRRRLDVSFDVVLEPWTVYGDAAGLSRALLNILDNAAKWSPHNGVVEVKMERSGDSIMAICVSDQGPGIPDDERDLVFERFYRATASRSMPGSGLGLAIVRQVVARHGGTIEALPAEGGGTLMRMTLPGSDLGNPEDAF